MPEPTVTLWYAWWSSSVRTFLWESGLRVPWLIAFNVVGVAGLVAGAVRIHLPG